MDLKTEKPLSFRNIQAVRNRKGWNSPQSLPYIVSFEEEGQNVRAGE